MITNFTISQEMGNVLIHYGHEIKYFSILQAVMETGKWTEMALTIIIINTNW